MRRNLTHLLLIAAVLAAGCGAASPPEPAEGTSIATTEEKPAPDAPRKTFMWKLTAPGEAGKSFHLLGSVHVARPDFYPLGDTIERAYAEADVLAVEVNLSASSQAQLGQLVLSRAALPPDETLVDKIGPEAWARLLQFLAGFGVPGERVARFKPWFAAFTITLLRAAAAGFQTALGIDNYFLAKGDKEVVELESIESQLAMLDDIPDELEVLMLEEAMEGSLQAGGDMAEMMDAWLAADPEQLADVMFGDLEEHPEYEPIYEHLIIGRNRNMAAAIEKLLETHAAPFVVVGAGHLVGDEGLLAIFESRGYSVAQQEQ